MKYFNAFDLHLHELEASPVLARKMLDDIDQERKLIEEGMKMVEQAISNSNQDYFTQEESETINHLVKSII